MGVTNTCHSGLLAVLPAVDFIVLVNEKDICPRRPITKTGWITGRVRRSASL
jgi:hypothetical protein